MTYKIEVGKITIIVVRKNIKNIHLAVYPPDGRVRISSPLFITKEAVMLFAASKLSWIIIQQRKLEERKRDRGQEYLAEEGHYFLGKRYSLNLIEHNGLSRAVLNGASLDLYMKKGSDAKQRKIVLNEWYRKELKKIIPDLLDKWEDIIGVTASEWGVKIMKTRWGTCNRNDRRIWLNLELVKKPVICLEYVIVHELVHLLERLHNDKFKRHMDSFLPMWRSIRNDLNKL